MFQKYKLKSITPGSVEDNLLTLTVIPGLVGRLLKKKQYDIQLEGEGTVWFHYPSGERVGTFLEYIIVNLVKQSQFNNTPHKLKENILKRERETELEWLKWFYSYAEFGPADSDVREGLKKYFMTQTGKNLPIGYNLAEDGETIIDFID